MANFNINIGAEPNIPYTPTNDKIRQGDCLTGITGIPLGIVNNVNTPGITFLLSEYTGGLGWKTLNISNLQYNNDSFFDLAYNGSTITPNVDPNVVVQAIPVTSVATNEAIPLLFANYDNDVATLNSSIGFDLEIIDTNDVSLGKIRIGIVFLYIECIPPAVKEKIGIVSTDSNSCFLEKVVSIKVPSESTRYVSTAGSVTTYSRVQIYVKEAATSGTIIASEYISRSHGGNIC